MPGRYLIGHDTLASAIWNYQKGNAETPMHLYATPNDQWQPEVSAIMPKLTRKIRSAIASPIGTWEADGDKSCRQPVIDFQPEDEQELVDTVEYITAPWHPSYVLCSSACLSVESVIAALTEWHLREQHLFLAAERIMNRNHHRKKAKLRPGLINLPSHDGWLAIFGTFKAVSPVALLDAAEDQLMRFDKLLQKSTETPYYRIP